MVAKPADTAFCVPVSMRTAGLICTCDIRSGVICNLHPSALHFVIDLKYHSHNAQDFECTLQRVMFSVFQFGNAGT